MDVFQLAPSHVWRAAPGCRILVVDNGGLRCDIPHDWIVYSLGRHVFAIDRFPPNNRCMVAISCKRVSSEVMALPLGLILEEWVRLEERPVVERSRALCFRRWPLEASWLQLRLADPGSGPEKSTRVCVARADRTQAVVVFDYESADETALESVWQTLMDSLAIGDYIADPLTGRRRMQRG